MPKPLAAVLADIAQGKPPRVLLIGGSSEFLAQHAFHEIRDAIVAKNPSISVENYEPGTELASILDSYRTMSLFGGARLLVVNEVNAFVSAKEIASLYEKALTDWRGAKTDRKRASSAAKLLHVLGLAGADLEMTDRAIASALGVTLDQTLTDMLAFCRATGKKAGRGEDDAALLMEAIARGGASGAILLMRTGEVPRDSATIDLIEKQGAVVAADLTREGFSAALENAIAEVASDASVRFDNAAITRLKQRLGVERTLAEEIRQMIGIHSFARTHNLNLKSSMQYNRFKDSIAEKLGDYLKTFGLVRQRPHPFPLHKKWEAARTMSESDLFRALAEIADLDIKRKSGGIPVDLGLETFLLQRVR